jgi:hypothetical protein
MTPSLAVIRIQTAGRRGFPIWIPLFLLWIPVVLLSPLILLAVLAVRMAGRVNPWRAIAAFWAISCNLPGTHIHVSSKGNQVPVRIV